MISIIIPAYNEEKIIGVLLTSLAKQDCAKNLEVMVADAFSKDRTRDVAKSYGHNFHSLIVVDGGMPGPGRNKGARASSGEIIFFIDADLYIEEKDFISKSVEYFKKHNLGIAPTYLAPISRRLIDKFLVGFYNFVLYLSKYIIRPLGAMCIMCTKEAFLGAGGYPEDVIMNEDHDFVLNTSKKFKYGVVPFYIQFSVRRLDKEGRPGLAWKYTQATYHNVIHGPIRKPIFEYEFGNHPECKDK